MNLKSKLPANINKKLILKNLPFALFVWIGDKLSYACRHSSNFLLGLVKGISDLFKPPYFSFNITDILIGVIVAIAMKWFIVIKGKNAKKYRKGIEYGSARWGTAEEVAPLIDENFYNNIILTQTERVTMKPWIDNKDLNANKNVLIIGGSGSGKTRGFIKPNLMQMHSSYVVTDPKGTVLVECGKLLEKGGYRIKVLNTVNFKKSLHYNPFEYIKSEKDIMKLVNTLIENTKGEGNKSGDDFWVKAEQLLYNALIGYIWYEAPEEEKNFTLLLDMLNSFEVREDDENFKNAVDRIFDELEERDPDHYAVRQYAKFKLAAGKTAKSILVSCGARLAPFDIKELRELMEYDELELDTLGDVKSALFIITSDTDSTFDFITAMVVSQLFNILCTKADDVYHGSLRIHVRCLLDEVANITIPNLHKIISVIRSRGISACLVVQAKSQLKAIYKEQADTIIGCCDSILFLGGREPSTLKDLAETLGKETIDMFNTSETRSNQNSYGLNYQKVGKSLMSEDEIAVMKGSKCILQLKGCRPFLSDKFDITKHPRYKYLSDADKKNEFDIQKYQQSRKPKLNPEEKVQVFTINMENLQFSTERPQS